MDGSQVAAAPRSQQEAFAFYVVPEIELLLRVARTLSYREAEDLVQETLLRAYRAIDRFDGQHPRAWLLTILRNAAANHFRKRVPFLSRDSDLADGPLLQHASPHDGPEQIVVDPTFDAAVEAALQALPLKARQVIELVDVRGLSYAEAAAALGVPTGTVMSRLHRARERMRSRLPASVDGEE